MKNISRQTAYRKAKKILEDTEKEKELLTRDQIENWRSLLLIQIGPYAIFMSDEEIQQARDRMQEEINNMGGIS